MIARVFVVAVAMVALAGCRSESERATHSGHVPSTREVGQLVLVAVPLKETVSRSEPVLVEVAVHNHTSTPFTFRPMFFVGGRLTAEIRDAGGRPVRPEADVLPPMEPLVTLGPGEAVVDTVDLRCPNATSEDAGCTEVYDLSAPGRYDIRLLFAPLCDRAGCADALQLVSEWFSVRVEG